MINTYDDLKKYQFKNDGNIPKIVFRTGRYNVDELPKQVKDLYENEMLNNPDYSLFYFGDSDVDNFVIQEYGILMFDYMNKLIPKAYQADFWRYLVLFKYGGIYIDFTMHTIVPYDEILKSNYSQIYVRDSCDICGIYNAFMATIPNTNILQKAIEKVKYNIINKYVGVSALDVTGPAMLGRIFKEELNLQFYDLIPIGNIKKDMYLYSNPQNEYIQDEFGLKIIKNRIKDHYELAYDEKPHPLLVNVNNEIKPMNHYSRLWSDGKIYR